MRVSSAAERRLRDVVLRGPRRPEAESVVVLGDDDEPLEPSVRAGLEKVISKLFFYGQTMLSFGRLVSPQEQIDGIRAVTAADVKRVANAILRPSNRSVSWVLPK